MTNLLSKQLLEKIADRSVHVLLGLSATSCQGKWLKCKITIDDTIIFNDTIESYRELEFEKTCVDPKTSISIVIDSKDDSGTTVDSNGSILENQSISIKKCEINGANIIDNGYIYNGKYTMVLNEAKEKHYKESGFILENNDYNFYENGIWTLVLPVPALAGIIQSVRKLEEYETVQYSDIIDEIITRIDHDNSN